MNKITLIILLSVASLLQACDKNNENIRSFSTSEASSEATFVDPSSELGQIMQSMNDQEAQGHLDSLRKLAREEGLKSAIDLNNKGITNLRKLFDSTDPDLIRIINYMMKNAEIVKKEFQSK